MSCSLLMCLANSPASPLTRDAACCSLCQRYAHRRFSRHFGVTCFLKMSIYTIQFTVPYRARSAQTMWAFLLANATAATFWFRLPNRRFSQPSVASTRRSVTRTTARAPWISSVRKYTSPLADAQQRGLAPLECCRGPNPARPPVVVRSRTAARRRWWPPGRWP